MKNKLILIGGGGHCQSVIDVVEATEKYEIVAIVDQAHKRGEKVSGYEITGTDDQLEQLVHPEVHFLITVGQIGSSGVRYQLYQKVRQAGGNFITVVSPWAYVSPRAVIRDGSIVMHNALINAYAQVGANTIINTKALIEHGTQVGSHCHVATGAIINGDCRVGDHVFIGSQATIVQGVSVEDGIVVGAGAVVTCSLPEPGTYIGMPARKKHEQ